MNPHPHWRPMGFGSAVYVVDGAPVIQLSRLPSGAYIAHVRTTSTTTPYFYTWVARMVPAEAQTKEEAKAWAIAVWRMQ